MAVKSEVVAETVETVATEAKKEVVKKPRTTKKAVAKKASTLTQSTGRRKTAIARIRIVDGEGKIVVNGISLEEYFKLPTLQQIVKQPLVLTATENKYDVIVNVSGSGLSGQAGAVRQAIARILVKENETFKAELKKAGFLTRDSRQKERKKPGLKKARKSPQFSKR